MLLQKSCISRLLKVLELSGTRISGFGLSTSQRVHKPAFREAGDDLNCRFSLHLQEVILLDHTDGLELRGQVNEQQEA